jgi:hypothetical protein
MRKASIGRVLAVVVSATFEAVAAHAGPLDPLYLTSGDQSSIEIVQGNSVTSFSATSAGQYPIAVLGTIQTAIDGQVSGIGTQYTLTGTAIGPTNPALPCCAYDGTTDGTHNYIVNYSTGAVEQTGLNFSNPTVLFSAGGGGTALGITYDGVNNSLWVSSWTPGSSRITDYALNGSVLFSFTVPIGDLTSLAFDPGDGTLWFGTQTNQSTLYQYSTTGGLLSTATYAALAGDNHLGGEFQLATPLPAALPLFATGLGGLGLIGWRRKRKAQA